MHQNSLGMLTKSLHVNVLFPRMSTLGHLKGTLCKR